ncbi:hypothetical protein SAPIO_CDS10192 [Scedosporium apiospermum]|uniref:Nephrocystin 3-like N-terminal domain-containing protein n=1 Tax=Pseudallescheria apiosperma TaxID=563466 RepID=A0A084FUW8_PSEDA|nr:uncharacterized protein SAPIO_CDS10192 [Scedosporium apiospermum]KEZ38880.1 hypothetical protein SAPIO_CDS10192 [Scedosporium apiospermum]
MKASRDIITAVGLTVLYEPEDPNAAVADVVFVAGIGGHPVKTWLYTPPTEVPKLPPASKLPRRARSFRSKDAKVLTKLNPALSKSSSHLRLLSQDSIQTQTEQEQQQQQASSAEPAPEIYWPLDLLPHSCPSTRILTWGCSTVAPNGRLQANQNDIFAHAEDLLQELTLLRNETNTVTRPVIFVTHSLGGVIVKEVLRRSEADFETHARDLLPSTSAVIFLACPHRASEHAKLTDAVRSMASVCLDIPAGDHALQYLTGTSGFEIDLGREAFARMWNDYNFRVKTFQENLPVDEKKRQSAADFEVRRASSAIGDPRESAETFQATHLDICKFRSSQDQNYKILLSSLSSFILNETHKRRELNSKEKECLRALLPPGSAFRDTQPTASYPGTCLWLYDIPEFQAWHHRQSGYKNKLLWIKGKPGSGKTILLKSLRNRVDKQWTSAGSSVIWSVAEGRDLDTVFYLPSQNRRYGPNPAGVYRSLLGQLFPQDLKLRKAMLALYERNEKSGAETPISDAQIVSFFLDDYIDQVIETPTKRTFIFVDVADDCGPAYLQDLLGHLAQMARNSDFSICIASNHYASVQHHDTIEVVMREHNTDDILRYISLNLIAEWEDRNITVHRIADKANGVFLWAEIVVNILNAAIEEGAMQELIDDTIAELPAEIDGLYEWILSTLSPEEKDDALCLMQWVILASEPLRLNDLRVAVRLTRPWNPQKSSPLAALQVHQPPTSIRHIRRPGSATFESPYQFHRFMRSRSVGLLELKPDTRDGVTHEPLGLQRVQVIHDSVRSFFLSGRGYACLAGEKAASTATFPDAAHYVLLRACLDYLNMSDFESLGNGPLSPQTPPTPYEAESKFWRRNVTDQRNLVMSSYPFLQYAVDNLLYHLLSPLPFRYFFPQMALLRLLSSNRSRLWRRWTSLLGATTPSTILSASKSAEDLLTPLYPARFALERVLRTLSRLSSPPSPTAEAPTSPSSVLASSSSAMGLSSPRSPLSPITPRSASEVTTLWSAARGGASTGTGTGFGSLRTPLTPLSPGGDFLNLGVLWEGEDGKSHEQGYVFREVSA